MSALRITCPRCHAVLSVSNHQEESGHLGCSHCGQLIRLAQRQSILPAMATAPMVAPAFSSGGYWNQNASRRVPVKTPWLAIALSCFALFLTVLTVCATILMFQFYRPSSNTNRITTNDDDPKIEDQNPFDTTSQLVANEKAPELVKTLEPTANPVLPPSVGPAAPSNSPFGNSQEFAQNNSGDTGGTRPPPPNAPPSRVTPSTVTPPTVEPAPPPPRPEHTPNKTPIG